MIGVIPAAGRGKRLGNKCKALIKVKGKPILEYILENMKLAGMKKIIIIHNGNEIPNYVGNDYWGIPIKYVEQKRRKGIAHAIYKCKKIVDDDMLIILGDIIFNGNKSLIEGVKCFSDTEIDVTFMFGIQKIKNKRLIKNSYGITKSNPMEVIEKPTDNDLESMENYLGLGIYFARKNLFHYIKKTRVNKKTGEVEFTDTINQIPKNRCGYTIMNGFYKNINTEKDLKECEENL